MPAVEVNGSVLEDLISNLPENAIALNSTYEFGTTVFLEGDAFAGLAVIGQTPEPNSPSLVGIYVFPGYRRRGYGRAMLKMAIELCVERNMTPVRIGTVSSALVALIETLPLPEQQQLVTDNATLNDIFDLQN